MASTETYGDKAQEGLKALLALIGGSSPVSALAGGASGAVTGAASTPVGQNPIPNAMESASKGLKPEKQILDPAQEGTKKAIADYHYDMATQALQSQVPAGHIMDHVGIQNNSAAPQAAESASQTASPENGNSNLDPNAMMQGLSVLKQLIAGSGSQGGQQAGYQPPKLGILDTLLPGLNPAKYAEATAYGTARGQGMGGIPAKIAEAEQVPLTRYQSAELQNKKDVARQSQLSEFNKPLAPEQSAKLSALMEGKAAVDELSSMLLSGNDPSGLIKEDAFTPNWFKSAQARDYQGAVERALQQKTRAETGAAMSPKELKNAAARYKPRAGDSVSNIKKRLKPLYSYFDGAIKMTDPYGINQQRANKTQIQSDLANSLIAEKQRRMALKQAGQNG